MTKLAGHVQRQGDDVRGYLCRALFPAIKFLTGGVDPYWVRDRILPAYDEANRPMPFIWARKWNDDMASSCVAAGRPGGDRLFEHNIRDYAHWRAVTGCNVGESFNERVTETVDSIKRKAACDAQYARRMAEHGFWTIGGGVNVGHEDYPLVVHYEEFFRAPQVYYGKHEYGWPVGLWEWSPDHVFRYRKDVEILESAGIPVPEIFISEFGWDKGIYPPGDEKRGFRDAPHPENYPAWVFEADRQYSADPRVRYVSIFQTGANPDWRGFCLVGTREGEYIADHVRNSPISPPPPPKNLMQRLMALAEPSVIPMTPGHALFDAIEADDRMPCSREGRSDLDGERFAWQWAYDSAQNTRWLYVCEEGDWGNILKAERPN